MNRSDPIVSPAIFSNFEGEADHLVPARPRGGIIRKKPDGKVVRRLFDIEGIEKQLPDDFDTADLEDLLLLPLILVMRQDGVKDAERKMLMELLRLHGIDGRAKLLQDFIRQVYRDEAYRRTQEARLRKLLDHLATEERRAMVDILVQLCVQIARSHHETKGRPISDREGAELRRIEKLLGAPKDLLLRHAPELFVPSKPLPPPPARGSRKGPPKAPPRSRKTAPPRSLAALFRPSVFDKAFKLCDRYYDIMEGCWKAGKGALDDKRSMSDLSAPEQIIIDGGVALLPAAWAKETTYFIGDLHGDIEALEEIIRVTGVVEDDQVRLLFLGDYGDRGNGTMAVWLRLFELLTSHPGRVLLLKGNHEDVVRVRTTGDKGETFTTKWWRPRCANGETYFALGYLLQGKCEWIEAVLDLLPSMAILPDGLLAVHGGCLPRWHANDGWPASLPEDAKRPIEAKGLADLRKPQLQYLMRWVDMEDKDDCYQAWARYPTDPRLPVSKADFDAFCRKTGIRRLVHGHTHPPEGFQSSYEARMTALNSSRNTGGRPCIARYAPSSGALTKIEIRLS